MRTDCALYAPLVGATEGNLGDHQDQGRHREAGDIPDSQHPEGHVPHHEPTDEHAATQRAAPTSAPLTRMATIRLDEKDRRNQQRGRRAEEERGADRHRCRAHRIDVEKDDRRGNEPDQSEHRCDAYQSLIGMWDAWWWLLVARALASRPTGSRRRNWQRRGRRKAQAQDGRPEGAFDAGQISR